MSRDGGFAEHRIRNGRAGRPCRCGRLAAAALPWCCLSCGRGASSHSVWCNEREELRQLRRENQRLRQEKEILKKAAAYFAAETNPIR